MYAIAPAERLSSAEQSALMLRKGPRLRADACDPLVATLVETSAVEHLAAELWARSAS